MPEEQLQVFVTCTFRPSHTKIGGLLNNNKMEAYLFLNLNATMLQ